MVDSADKNGGRASMLATAHAAQITAGVIAARHRGDYDGANALLTGVDDSACAAGSLLLADLALGLLARAEGRGVDDVASELSLHLAELPAVGWTQ